MKINKTIIACLLFSAILFVACQKNEATTDPKLEIGINGKAILKASQTSSLSDLIAPNVKAQFGTSEFKIQELQYEVGNDAKFTAIQYKTSTGITSYALHVKVGKQSIKAGEQTLSAEKEFIVDCTGTCDCRERWYPSTGAVESTCSPCTMKVTEVVRES
jgi:hypothetical protein